MTDPHADLVAALRAALHENERLRRNAPAAAEPVAIIGMGCRYPGGVRSPGGLWDLVATATDALEPCPDTRGWPADAVTAAGFIDIDAFDASFFGISPREALGMSPQQRILLEIAWETLEHARLLPARLRGRNIGVFTGIIAEDPDPLAPQLPDASDPYPLTARTCAMTSGRISHVFDLRGPAITLDTACSSSMTAIHLACRALHSGDCELALAGGIRVINHPGWFNAVQRAGQLAPDGRSKSFAASADGAGWSEGAGMLLLEPLSQALAHNHRVLAVIRGSALNHTGARAATLSAPSGPAQYEVILRALAAAGLDPDRVDAVEGTGLGTALGDPVEANALLNAYGPGRERPLFLGSVKSNIGHSQAAGGIAGVIKMVEAIRHGRLPKTLHVDAPTPKVDWAAGQLALLTGDTPWPDTGEPRRAAVTAIGGSGTCGHLILEQAPPTPAREPAAPRPQTAAPVLISARTTPALRAQAARLRDFVARNPDLALCDLAYSLATTRTAFAHAVSLHVADRQQLLAALDAVALGRPHGAVRPRRAVLDEAVFAGAQHVDLPTYAFQHRSYKPGPPQKGKPCRTTAT